jgi:hypothetical protein
MATVVGAWLAATLGCFKAVDRQLVLALFNAHGAIRPGSADILADDAGAMRACVLGVGA